MPVHSEKNTKFSEKLFMYFSSMFAKQTRFIKLVMKIPCFYPIKPTRTILDCEIQTGIRSGSVYREKRAQKRNKLKYLNLWL